MGCELHFIMKESQSHKAAEQTTLCRAHHRGGQAEGAGRAELEERGDREPETRRGILSWLLKITLQQ